MSLPTLYFYRRILSHNALMLNHNVETVKFCGDAFYMNDEVFNLNVGIFYLNDEVWTLPQ
jgi:hypothetical protein